MTPTELQSQIALGEDSRRQFKRDVTNGGSLAGEMASFANSEGGTVYLGVADDGSLPGLSRADVTVPLPFIWTIPKISFGRHQSFHLAGRRRIDRNDLH